MENTSSSFEGILEDLLTVSPEELEAAVRAYIERFPHHGERLRKFAADARTVNHYFSAAKREAGPNPPRSLCPIGRFQPIEELARGSQGIVYKAEQIGIARTVALKVIREGVLASAKERLRFENEIQLISRLKHPNIVAVYDCGIDAGRVYFAMEYIDGRPLNEVFKERERSIAETLKLFVQIADAVSYAHQHGVIHRDLKPSNILVDSRQIAHILDFGLAKAINDPAAQCITETGVFTGTWLYASPEQVHTDQSVTDIRSDVYTLGVIVFQMLTGCLPYPVEADTHVAREHILRTPPRRPSSLREGISDDLDTIVLRALAKETDRRYQSAAALRDDVQRYLRNEAIEAKRDSRWYILKKTVENYRWQFRTAAAGLLTLLAFSVVVTYLYFEAIRARATTEARTDVVRVGQRYIHNRMRDYYALANTAEAYKANSPEAIAVSRLKKPRLGFPPTELEALGEIPDFAFDADQSAQANQVQWLQHHRSSLSSLAVLTQAHRFLFPTEKATSPWLMEHSPQGAHAARNLCMAFVAQSHSGVAGRVDEVLHWLSAARSLSLDLADEPAYLYKSAAIECRLRIYEALQNIVPAACDDATRLAAYQEWLADDPPLPRMEDAQLYERTRVLQYLEASVEADPWQGRARINLDMLNQLTSGYYEKIGFLTKEMRASAEQANPERIVEALNHFTAPAALNPIDRQELRTLWPLLSDPSGFESLIARTQEAKRAALEMFRKCAE